MIQFFGLLLALAPSALMLLLKPSIDSLAILAVFALCSLIGSWMVLIRMKNKFARLVASLELGIVFFFVNVFVSIFVRGSGHTPM